MYVEIVGTFVLGREDMMMISPRWFALGHMESVLTRAQARQSLMENFKIDLHTVHR